MVQSKKSGQILSRSPFNGKLYGNSRIANLPKSNTRTFLASFGEFVVFKMIAFCCSGSCTPHCTPKAVHRKELLYRFQFRGEETVHILCMIVYYGDNHLLKSGKYHKCQPLESLKLLPLNPSRAIFIQINRKKRPNSRRVECGSSIFWTRSMLA